MRNPSSAPDVASAAHADDSHADWYSRIPSCSSSTGDVGGGAAHAVRGGGDGGGGGGGGGRTFFNQSTGYKSATTTSATQQYGMKAGAKKTRRIDTYGRRVPPVGNAVTCGFCKGDKHHIHQCPIFRRLGTRLWCKHEDVKDEIRKKLREESLDPSTAQEVQPIRPTTTYHRINKLTFLATSVRRSLQFRKCAKRQDSLFVWFLTPPLTNIDYLFVSTW